MLLKESDLFVGLSHEFVGRVMAKAQQKSYEKGQYLFHAGEPARTFYTLVRGCVKLRTGAAGGSVFVVNQIGESFGWSSILKRDGYAASAESTENTVVMVYDRDDLLRILEGYPSDELLFMKHLAGMLGQRLIDGYRMIHSALGAAGHRSYGTGYFTGTTAD